MTEPKNHLPGQVAMLTRRCTQRKFLLHNDESGEMKEAMGYIVGLGAIRHHQVLSAWCTMSNHYHGAMLDRTGTRSRFAQDVNNFTTKTVNKRLKRRESIWSSDKPGDMFLTDTKTVIKELLYIWLNPVEAGLVDRVEDWDHFQILPKHWGKTLEFKRPDFFTGRSDTPEIIRFTPMPPPGFEHLKLADVIALFEGWIREREKEILARRKRPSMGMPRVYRQSPFSTPKTSQPMYTRNPKFAGSDKTKVSKVISAYRFFIKQYRAALRMLKAGKEAIFPPGTIAMCQRFKHESGPPDPANPCFPRYARFV